MARSQGYHVRVSATEFQCLGVPLGLATLIRRVLRSGISPCGELSLVLAAPAAHGESLSEALAKAYQTNPAAQR